MSLFNLSLSQMFVLAATWSTGTWVVFDHSARQPLVNQPMTWFLVIAPWLIITVYMIDQHNSRQTVAAKKPSKNSDDQAA